MALRKLVECTLCAASLLAVASCADGTGKALTPTLPTDGITANVDARLKATAPQPVSPQGSVQVANLTPELKTQNAESTVGSAPLSYQFEVYDNNGAVLVTQSNAVAATTPTETMWSVPDGLLQLNGSYSWRVRAIYEGVPGGAQGGWSSLASFATPLPVSTSSSSSGGGSAKTGAVPCGGSSGKEIVDCVGDAYPGRLAATSKEQRFRNMEFLRDRIIETGLCKGINLGLNNKRGGPEISRDFIVLRGNSGKNGRDRGVDIASGYDANQTKLKLTWQVFDGDKNWGHPFYNDYGPVDCSGVN